MRACTGLLMLLIAMSSAYGFYNQKYYYSNLLYPYGILNSKQFYPILTNGLIHAGYLHLIGNLLVIHAFGNELERILRLQQISTIHLWLIWILGVIVGGVIDYLWNRNNEQFYTCGASNGSMALFAAYLLLDKKYVMQFLQQVHLQQLIIVGLFIGFTAFKLIQNKQQINYRSHLVGILMGLSYSFMLR